MQKSPEGNSDRLCGASCAWGLYTMLEAGELSGLFTKLGCGIWWQERLKLDGNGFRICWHIRWKSNLLKYYAPAQCSPLIIFGPCDRYFVQRSKFGYCKRGTWNVAKQLQSWDSMLLNVFILSKMSICSYPSSTWLNMFWKNFLGIKSFSDSRPLYSQWFWIWIFQLQDIGIYNDEVEKEGHHRWRDGGWYERQYKPWCFQNVLKL